MVAQAGLLAGLLVVWLAFGEGWGTAFMVAGGLLAAAGAMLGGTGFLALGRNLSAYPAPLNEAVLVERGPYRLARHPIYGGIVLGGLGFSLVDGNWPGLVLCVLLLGLFLSKAGFEERHLIARYPDYILYRSRVRRRLIPWVL